MDDTRADWISVATDRAIVVRSLFTCLVVGGILTAINQGDRLIRGELDPEIAVKIRLTFLVPFLVATFSAAAAVRGRSPGPVDTTDRAPTSPEAGER